MAGTNSRYGCNLPEYRHKRKDVKKSTCVSPVDREIRFITSSYLGGSPPDVALEPPVPVKRTRVTQEMLVEILVAARREGPLTAEGEEIASALYSSVERLVALQAVRFYRVIKEPVEDLVGICWQRIWNKLEKFDSSKGAFTTWIVAVCQNVLRSVLTRGAKRRRVFTVPSADMSTITTESARTGALFREGVAEMCRKHPDFQGFICSLLGDPRSGEVPSHLYVHKACKESGIKLHRGKEFLERVIKPFMHELFAR